MYYKIVQYVYVTTIFLFCSIIGIALLKDLQAQGFNFFYLFTVLCIPIFDKILEYMKWEKFFTFERHTIHTLNILKAWIVLLIVVALLYIWWAVPSIMTLLILVMLILFRLDSRIAFLISLILFLYIGFFLLLSNKEAAESLSIYAYYFLIIGVVVEILQSFTTKKIKDER